MSSSVNTSPYCARAKLAAVIGSALLASWSSNAFSATALSQDDPHATMIRNSIKSMQLKLLNKENALGNMKVVAANSDTAATQNRAKFGVETNSELVFTPLAPCTLMDTRFGTIAPYNTRVGVGQTISLSVNDSLASQGGEAAGCGVPGNDPPAIAVAITTIFSSSGGTLKAWGAGSEPSGVIGNYSPGTVDTAFAIVPLNQGVSDELNIKSINGNPFINVAVVGYFLQPTATALDCTTVNSGTVVWANNSLTTGIATCPTGYAVTGGGFSSLEGSLGWPGVWLYRSMPSGNSWHVIMDNQTGGNRSALVYAQCCRTPGQ